MAGNAPSKASAFPVSCGDCHIFPNGHGGGSSDHGVLKKPSQIHGPFVLGKPCNIRVVYRNLSPVHRPSFVLLYIFLLNKIPPGNRLQLTVENNFSKSFARAELSQNCFADNHCRQSDDDGPPSGVYIYLFV